MTDNDLIEIGHVPEVTPRRPYIDDEPDCYQESDNDFAGNNMEAVVWFLDNRDKLAALLAKFAAPVAQGLTDEQIDRVRALWLDPERCDEEHALSYNSALEDAIDALTAQAAVTEPLQGTQEPVAWHDELRLIQSILNGLQPCLAKAKGLLAVNKLLAAIDSAAPAPSASSDLKVPEGYRLVRAEVRDEMIRMAASPAALTYRHKFTGEVRAFDPMDAVSESWAPEPDIDAIEYWAREEGDGATVEQTIAMCQRIRALLAQPAAPTGDEAVADGYGDTDFGYTLAGIELAEGDKRLMSMLVKAFGTDHPAVDDLAALLFRARAILAAQPPAAAEADKRETRDE